MKKVALALGSIAVLTSLAFSAASVAAQGVSSATPLCFCKITDDKTKYQDCAGEPTKVDLGSASGCDEACSLAGFALYSTTSYYDYLDEGTPCNWQYSGGTCSGPDPAQTSNSCKTALGNYQGSKSPTAPTAPAYQQGPHGSVVGAVLPLSDLSVPQVIGQLIRGALGVLGSIAFLLFVYAGFTYMTAQGDTKKITSAKQTMIWAVLGIIIIFGAYAIVSSIITTLTGSSS